MVDFVTCVNTEHQKIDPRHNPRAQPYSPGSCDHSALIFDIGHCVIMEESMSEYKRITLAKDEGVAACTASIWTSFGLRSAPG